MNLVKNRRTLISAVGLVVTGVAMAFGLVDPADVTTGPLTYENADKPPAPGDPGPAVGLIGALLGLVSIFQRSATGKVQADLTKLVEAQKRNVDDGK